MTTAKTIFFLAKLNYISIVTDIKKSEQEQ